MCDNRGVYLQKDKIEYKSDYNFWFDLINIILLFDHELIYFYYY